MRWTGVDRWQGGAHERELVPMTWAELRALADERLGDRLAYLHASAPHSGRRCDARDELTRSRAACEEQLGIECTSLAYPYGDVDERVVAATARAGYRAAAALPTRLDSRDPLAGRASASIGSTTRCASA